MVSNEDLFVFDTEEIDVKEMRKIRIPMIQNDTPILKFRVYNYGEPLDLTEYHIELRMFLVNGELYSEEDNLSVEGNEITIKCDSTVTQAVGENVGSLRIWNKTYKQKSTYQIILRVKSVSDYEESGKVSTSTISILEHLDASICRAIDLKTDFEAQIEVALKTKEELESNVITASESDTKLKQTIVNANESNNTLKNTINSATTSNTELSNAITLANNTKTNLDKSIGNGNAIKTELNDCIANSITKKNELQSVVDVADEKLEEFKKFDTDQIVEKTNNLYNEMFPTKDLIAIEHNLNVNPLVQFTIVNEGYGLGGYGNTSYGGISECNLGTYKVKYLSKNKLTITVSNNYYKENPIVDKVNDYEYNLTFNNYAKSMNVKLLVVDNNSYLIDEEGNYIIDELGRYLMG